MDGTGRVFGFYVVWPWFDAQKWIWVDSSFIVIGLRTGKLAGFQMEKSLIFCVSDWKNEDQGMSGTAEEDTWLVIFP